MVEMRSGDVGEDAVDGTCEEVVEEVVVIVWYVLTGSLSTTDFGARHLLLRIRDRSNKRA